MSEKAKVENNPAREGRSPPTAVFPPLRRGTSGSGGRPGGTGGRVGPFPGQRPSETPPVPESPHGPSVPCHAHRATVVPGVPRQLRPPRTKPSTPYPTPHPYPLSLLPTLPPTPVPTLPPTLLPTLLPTLPYPLLPTPGVGRGRGHGSHPVLLNFCDICKAAIYCCIQLVQGTSPTARIPESTQDPEPLPFPYPGPTPTP